MRFDALKREARAVVWLSFLGGRLVSLRTIAAWVAAVATFFGLSPLASEMLRNWMERSGYLARPEEGIAWLVSSIASVAQFSWFYPVLGVIVCSAIGLWLEAAYRAYSKRRLRKLRSLGLDMRMHGRQIRTRQGRINPSWPNNVRDIRPQLASLFLRIKAQRMYAPADEFFKRNDGARDLCDYLDFVGTYLSEGQIKAAKKRALQLKAKLSV